MNAAFTKGKFINQMQQRFAKCQFIKRGRPQLAQQLAGGEMNAAGELIDLAGCGLNLRRITRPLHQLRLDLNGGDVLTDFVVQLSRQVFRVSSSVWISFSANARRAASSASSRCR